MPLNKAILQRQRERDNEILKREQEKINETKEKLKQCQHLTDQMVDILAGFDEMLTRLTPKIQKISNESAMLRKTSKNVTSTLTAVNEVVQHQKAANGQDDDHTKYSIQHETDEYLKCVSKYYEARNYFTDRKDFKGAKSNIQKLKNSLAQAWDACQAEFQRLIIKHSEPIEPYKILDPNKTPGSSKHWPIDAKFELIPSDVVRKLGAIAVQMDKSERTVFINVLQEKRMACLRKTLKNLSHTKDQDEKDSTSFGRYEMGTHKKIFDLQFFCSILEMERELLKNILKDTSYGKDPTKLYKIFSNIFENPMGYFHKKFREFLEGAKKPTQMFPLIDIMFHIKKLLPGYKKVLQCDNEDDRKGHSTISAIQGDVVAACGLVIEAYLQHIKDYVDPYARQKRKKTGEISSLTIETMNVIERLKDWRSAINHHNQILERSMSENDEDTITRLTLIIIDALDTNLIAKAKSYKRDDLSTIFLMNNYVHINKLGQQSSELKDSLGKELGLDLAFYEKFQKKTDIQKEKYFSTWNNVLKLIELESAINVKDEYENCDPKKKKGIKKKIKDRFTNFNEEFNELFDHQRTYSVVDNDLRSGLRNGNVERIVEKYKKFLDVFHNINLRKDEMGDAGKSPKKKIKSYDKQTVQDIEKKLDRFFDEDDDLIR